MWLHNSPYVHHPPLSLTQTSCLKKSLLISLSICLLQLTSAAQMRYSFATDFSVLRNFSRGEKFGAIGQTVQGQIHFTKQHSAYAWLVYYNNGKFSNSFIATAKQPATTPSLLPYYVNGGLRIREISFGWKRYIKGAYNDEEQWNVYGIAGLGLLFIKAENSYNPLPDTALYKMAATPMQGTGNFNKLTLDLGLGVERPLGGQIFVYFDLRTALPLSHYPSPFLHTDAAFPKAFSLSVGVRLLIGDDLSE